MTNDSWTLEDEQLLLKLTLKKAGVENRRQERLRKVLSTLPLDGVVNREALFKALISRAAEVHSALEPFVLKRG